MYMSNTNSSGGNLSQELEQTKGALQTLDVDKNKRLSKEEMRGL